ncbi:VCBS domain-containing protein, partial [Bradyrhizobium sp.]|uniref:VCBS domain-containing protein n=1 Tax=Bradyrhizobium sp. TaxID=376 RepID=UPI003BB2115A
MTDPLHGLTPSFPVTINAPAVAGSLTMNDFGTTAPVLINQSTLTIGSSLTIAADSVIQNFGAISVGGVAEILNQSVLLNSGTLNLAQGGDFRDQSSITNTGKGTIDVTGGTLNVLVDVANSGKIIVESGATLSFSSGTSVTNDGTIEVKDATLKVTGSIAGSGSVQIDSGALFELNGSDVQNVVFAGTSAEMQIDASSFGGSIVGLAATDELDLRTIGYGLNTTGIYVSDPNNDGGILTITDGSHSISMTLVGDYRNAHFAGSTDGNGGTLITLNAADDVPAFVSAETTQSGVITELSNTTGSSVHESVSGSIHFTDIDLTDRPTATITSQTVTWTAADHTTDLSSSLSQSELDALEQAVSLIQSNNTNNGVIGWTYSIADSSLDFLAAGDTAKVVSTVTLNDHQGATDTATVTITITGTNDAPVIVDETDPSTQTVILARSPIVLDQGVDTNLLGLQT